MELQNVLQQRRSIRKYKQQPVEKEKIGEMIQAAVFAESWKNSQTPRYHVIQSKEMLEQFKKKCLPEFNQKNVADAPILIVTTFVKDRAGFLRNGSPDNELQNGWGIYDCGLANQNLILKATEPVSYTHLDVYKRQVLPQLQKTFKNKKFTLFNQKNT